MSDLHLKRPPLGSKGKGTPTGTNLATKAIGTFFPLILTFSCSVGIFYRSFNRDKNQFKPFSGCSGVSRGLGKQQSWFTNLHYPGICSELLLIASHGSEASTKTSFQFNVPSNSGPFFRIELSIHKLLPKCKIFQFSWENERIKSQMEYSSSRNTSIFLLFPNSQKIMY